MDILKEILKLKTGKEDADPLQYLRKNGNPAQNTIAAADNVTIKRDPNSGVDWFNNQMMGGVPLVDKEADYRRGFQGRSEPRLDVIDMMLKAGKAQKPSLSVMAPTQRNNILPPRAKKYPSNKAKFEVKTVTQQKVSAPAQEAINTASTEVPLLETNSTSPEQDSLLDSMRQDLMYSFGKRKDRMDRLEADRTALAGKEPSGLFAADLSPMMIFLDEMFGGKMAQAYQAPSAKKDWQAQMNRLDDSYEKASDSLTADQAGYVLNKDKETLTTALAEDGQVHDVDMEKLKHLHNMEELKFKTENGLGKDDAFNQWLRLEQLKLARDGQRLQAENAEENRNDRRKKEHENDVERASKRLEGWAQLKEVFNRVAPYANMAPDKIPGYQNFGQAIMRKLPFDMYKPKEYREIIQDVSFLAQQYLKDTSGMSTTEQENLKTLANIGASTFSDATTLQRGIDLVVKMGLKKGRQIEAGYDKSVIDTLKSRGGDAPSDFNYKGSSQYPKTVYRIDEKGKRQKAEVNNETDEREANKAGFR